MKNTLILKDISITGILIGLITILNLIFSIFPIIMGYSINFYIIFFTLGLIIIKTKIIKYGFFILTPFILILYPNIYWINIIQGIIEYFFAIWCFYPFIFGDLIMTKLDNYENKKKLKLLVFAILFIFCWMIKLLLHTIAGYFWWTNHNWLGSFLINLPIITLNILFTIPVFIIIFNRTIEISKTYYLNIWNDVKV